MQATTFGRALCSLCLLMPVSTHAAISEKRIIKAGKLVAGFARSKEGTIPPCIIGVIAKYYLAYPLPEAKYKDLLKYAMQGDLENLKLLFLEYKVDLEAKNWLDPRPLQLAARNGHGDVVEFLFENGALIDAKGDEDWAPLHWAARRGHIDVVELLIQKGANIEAKNKSDWTPLKMAGMHGHKEVVKLLKKYGAVDDRWCLIQ